MTQVDNPILLGGCGSSGTSLLSHLLNGHPNLYCGAELHLLNKKALYEPPFTESKSQLARLLQKRAKALATGVKLRIPARAAYLQIKRLRYDGILTTGLLNNKYLGSSTYANLRYGRAIFADCAGYGLTLEDCLNLVQTSDSFKELIDRFFAAVLLRAGKQRWAEKTPNNCYCIGEFLSLYPAGQYIHIVRDGRDVVPSLIKRGASPEVAVRRWLHDTLMGYPYRHHSRCYMLKYEDLVSAPLQTLNQLTRFLGESESAKQMLASQTKNSPTNGHSSWSVKTSDPVSTQALEKWKKPNYFSKGYLEALFAYTHLSSKFLDSLGIDGIRSANDLLRALNYEATDCWNNNPRLSPKLMKHFFQEKVYSLLASEKLACDITVFL
ncbi:MAG: sulfotransferase [Leptolyngbya sp. SIO4C1]|nr:sulfotransferase [Leptolyngbya sp. SIO4C1]